MSFYSILERSLAAQTLTTLDELAAHHLVRADHSLLHVMGSALRCDHIGLGFAAGYRSALQCLLPTLAVERWAAMCVTESGGNHPRNIRCRVDGQGVVAGEKSFVSMASYKPQLIVVASAGEQDGRPLLKAVLMDSQHENVSVQTMPPLPMVPEIEHGAVRFEQAQGQLLAGDGYADFSKRFRTIEDAHVLMGFISILVSLSYRHGLPARVTEQGISLLASTAQLYPDVGTATDDSAYLHLHLAALFEQFKALCAEFESHLSDLPEHLARDWLRDKKLFGVAKQAREARHQRALAALF